MCHSSVNKVSNSWDTAAINSCFPALLTLLLTSSDYLLIYRPISHFIQLLEMQLLVRHLKLFIHISLWQYKVIKPEPWLTAPRWDRSGSDSINGDPTGSHWLGGWRLLICMGDEPDHVEGAARTELSLERWWESLWGGLGQNHTCSFNPECGGVQSSL